MHLVPTWAPNVHPMIIHFPIVFVLLAALMDVIHLVRPRGGLSRGATVLYVLGALSAVAAFLSGRSASLTVFMPGTAPGLVDDHRSWAMATTGALVGLSALRVGSLLWRRTEPARTRVLFVVLGLVVALLVQQTAERGARLVFEQGVGVVPGPVPASSEPLDRQGPDQAP